MCLMASPMDLLDAASNAPPCASDLARGGKIPPLPPSPSTPSSKETGKKKRVIRAAKLKQCKLDARREQWLAQVAGKLKKSEGCASSQDERGGKSALDASDGGVVESGLSLSGSQGSIDELRLKAMRQNGDMPLKSGKTEHENGFQGERGTSDLRRDSEVRERTALERRKHESLGSPSEVGYLKSRADIGEGEGKASEESSHGFSNWSSSDASTSPSNSSRASSSCGGSDSDDDHANEVDDWEVVADALDVQASLQEATPSKTQKQLSDRIEPLEKKATMMSSTDLDNCVLKPENKYRSGSSGARMRADAGRAWRPDDACRPPTLPRLSKQHSFPLQSGASVWDASHGSIWGLPPAPSHCPICTEELDTTDSSFMPCSCGFRLCLFCHHKIVLGDGRCPGCRKSYNMEVALKLSRSASVRPRV